ncbi:unnamed protein product [Nippostrongylus brasiliensis]|uniref:Intraflagellar transport protein 74 homolog (inferred by orthology to a human protein) n=1 Tax=Nippostrongylus brasiliensis TaxID=27835 RepID=A0A0N4XL88_NIPBR|nr:unnamed protein product [Nippostrongylus brasiliensis]
MARPPTAINPPHRPVTQQGLSGGRAVSRLGTRQVHDKSYFMGLLRSKINQITTETAHLEDVYQKGLRDRMELEAYEQRAKSSAMEVKELQRKLFNYNLLIDRMHTNHEVGDLEIEAKRAKESADEVCELRTALLHPLWTEKAGKNRFKAAFSDNFLMIQLFVKLGLHLSSAARALSIHIHFSKFVKLVDLLIPRFLDPVTASVPRLVTHHRLSSAFSSPPINMRRSLH